MAKPRDNNGWSKTKQVARKKIRTPAQLRKEELQEERQKQAEERFRQREMAKAKKLLGEDIAPRKSARNVLK